MPINKRNGSKPRIGARLMRAYRQTSYCVRVRGTSVRMRIGEPNAELRQVLRAHQRRSFAFITAWNPALKQLSKKENARRQRALLREVRKLHLTAFKGWGRSASGEWAEQSLFIVGIKRRVALRLGKNYGQAMLVVGDRSAVPRLMPC
jgi:hypothetical protein